MYRTCIIYKVPMQHLRTKNGYARFVEQIFRQETCLLKIFTTLFKTIRGNKIYVSLMFQ